MIGIPAFLIQMMLVVFPLVFILGAVAEARGHRDRKAHYAIIVFFGGVLAVGSAHVLSQASSHAFLGGLEVRNVASLRVDETTIAEPGELALLVDTLRQNRWFAPNHDRSGDEMRLFIKTRDGEYHRYGVSQLERKKGALITFEGRGSAYIEKLPEILAGLGVSLPEPAAR